MISWGLSPCNPQVIGGRVRRGLAAIWELGKVIALTTKPPIVYQSTATAHLTQVAFRQLDPYGFGL